MARPSRTRSPDRSAENARDSSSSPQLLGLLLAREFLMSADVLTVLFSIENFKGRKTNTRYLPFSSYRTQAWPPVAVNSIRGSSPGRLRESYPVPFRVGLPGRSVGALVDTAIITVVFRFRTTNDVVCVDTSATTLCAWHPGRLGLRPSEDGRRLASPAL